MQIEALKGIPVTFTVWAAEEYPASATILYDESANSHLPVEDLAVLAELTSARLAEARKTLNEKQISSQKKKIVMKQPSTATNKTIDLERFSFFLDFVKQLRLT